MNLEFAEHEFCAVCGRAADGEHCFCHFYEERGRMTFCSPRCADSYLHQAGEAYEGNGMRTWDCREVTRLAAT